MFPNAVGLTICAILLWVSYATATTDVYVPSDSPLLHYGPNLSLWYMASDTCGGRYAYSYGFQYQWVTMQFTGTAVYANLIRGTSGTRVAIEIDGYKVAEVDTYLNTLDCDTPIFQYKGLPYGPHTIKIYDLTESVDRWIFLRSLSYTTYSSEEISASAASASQSASAAAASISASEKARHDAVIGGAVGGSVGLLLLVITGLFLRGRWIRRRNAHLPVAVAEAGNSPDGDKYQPSGEPPSTQTTGPQVHVGHDMNGVQPYTHPAPISYTNLPSQHQFNPYAEVPYPHGAPQTSQQAPGNYSPEELRAIADAVADVMSRRNSRAPELY